MNKKLKKAITRSIILASSIIMATSSFAAGVKPMYQNDKWGFQNESGQLVVAAKYDGVGNTKGGFTPVLKGDKWGFINSDGKEVVKPIYDGVSNFRDGFAPALRGGNWGMINTSGVEVIQFRYDELYYFDSQGNANAKLGGNWGKINKEGLEVVPFIYKKSDVETKAIPTISELTVNNKAIDLNVYTIDGHNYIKLRDMAQILNGSEKQFEVTWSQQNQTIDLLSETPYTTVGGELEKDNNEKLKLRFNESKISKDGKPVEFLAYNINNNNYFKLRDITESFNIGLEWNQKTKGIEIDTSKDYIPE